MTYLAVFDWNGTVFDDISANFDGANAALATLGKPAINLKKYRDTFDFPIIHFYERNNVNLDFYLKDIKKANDAFFLLYEKLAAQCPARHGAEDLLQWLTKNNITIIILSNHTDESIRRNLNRLELLSYIDQISSNPHDNDIIFKMNKQERLQKLMEKQRFDPKKTFIIGDSLEEPQIAKNLGLLSISITGGCLSEERLKKAPKNYLINELPELKEVLAKEWAIPL